MLVENGKMMKNKNAVLMHMLSCAIFGLTSKHAPPQNKMVKFSPSVTLTLVIISSDIIILEYIVKNIFSDKTIVLRV